MADGPDEIEVTRGKNRRLYGRGAFWNDIELETPD
jgi:hypothetical protein